MSSQVPPGTENPYVRLFDPEMAISTIPILEDIQLSFDYSIARTNLSIDQLQAPISNIEADLYLYPMCKLNLDSEPSRE